MPVDVCEGAKQRNKATIERKYGDSDSARNNARYHQVLKWVDGGNFHRVDLFGNAHGTKFGTDAGADLAGADQGCDQRGKRPQNGYGNKRGQPGGCTESFKRRSGLFGKYNSCNKTG